MDIILTHENADFDAVASQLAAHKLVPEATPVLPSRQNRNVRLFLSLFGQGLPFVKAADLPHKPVTRAILVDTQHAQTIRGMGKKTRIEVIDHHQHDHKAKPNWQVHTEVVGATTTILAERIIANATPITPVEATMLMLGIYEDTGSLAYGTTTARDIRAAAWLLDQGALLDVVRGFIRHSLSEEQKRLYEQLTQNMESFDFGGISVLVATASASQPIEEISTIAHELRDVLEPAALFLLIDFGAYVQVVARSTDDTVDVGTLTERLGGGGHARAAAGVIRDRALADVRVELVAALHDNLRPGPTVADLMSSGVKTLAPSTRIREIHSRMRRYGYEGFPVVHDAHIVGLVTRRAVDRALDHGLDDLRADQIMEVGEVSVKPSDPLHMVQRVMSSSGWGQIPVVDDHGRISGIVTRTDLIKHLGPSRRGDRRSEVGAMLSAALPPALMAIAIEAGRRAFDMRLRLFVVGGVVRDLLLGYPLTDVDFVVEGDAVALTRALRDAFGGQMRSHERFGTGKWMLEPDDWRHLSALLDVPLDGAALPAHIDFVTARTEFYSAPTELPQVEQSSIKHDLHRRDFTINTLAIQLDPASFGALLDFYGGERDLADHRIRVLHSISFVDDPTRILRAARLEQRLDFRIDARTQELIANALPLLDRVSGDRIRHEIDLIFEEKCPEDALARLDELGVLRALNPALAWSDPVRALYADLRSARSEPLWPELAPLDLTLPYFGVLTFAIGDEDLAALCARIKVQRRTVKTLDRLRGLRPELTRLASDSLRPSEIDRILTGLNDWVLAAAWALAPNATARERIVSYARDLRHVNLGVDGETLLSRGHKPGPEFKTILAQIRAAWLDGEIHNPSEETALLERLLAERMPVAGKM